MGSLEGLHSQAQDPDQVLVFDVLSGSQVLGSRMGEADPEMFGMDEHFYKYKTINIKVDVRVKRAGMVIVCV